MIHRQRRKYKKVEISQDKIKLLESIEGWKWIGK